MLKPQHIFSIAAGSWLSLAVVMACVYDAHFFQEEAVIAFEKDVQPILTEHCSGCHNDNDSLSTSPHNGTENIPSIEESNNLDAAAIANNTTQLVETLGEDETKVTNEFKAPKLTTEKIEILKRWLAEGKSIEEHVVLEDQKQHNAI